MNGEPLPTPQVIAFDQPKSVADNSFTGPYATYTEFDVVFNEVDVSTGLNWLRLAATDKVPGVGLTGFTEYSWNVVAISSPAMRDILPSGLETSPYDGWTFQFTPATFLSGSGGGEIHPYFMRFSGPWTVLADLADQHPDKIAKGPDWNFYVAGARGTPEAHFLTVLKGARVLPTRSGPLDGLEEAAGYMYGITAQGVDDAKGLWHFGVLVTKLPFLGARYLKAYHNVSLGLANDQETQFVIDVGTKAEEVSAATRAAWNLWVAVETSQLNTIEAAASGDLEEAWRQSETCRWLAAYMVETMIAIHNEYVERIPFKRGEIKGRITLEAVLIVVPLTKLGQASKVSVLTKLTEVTWIRENPELLTILNRVIDLAKGNKPMPPVLGLSAPGLPGPTAGTEVGAAAERVIAKLRIKMAAGEPLRPAVIEALSQVVANAGEGPVMIRFKELQDLLLLRAPPSFGTTEGASSFLSNLLTYKDWLTSIRDIKQLWVFLDDGEEFVVVAGRAGEFRGNHIIKKQLLEVLRDSYRIPVADVNDTPVKIMQFAEHQGSGPSFHNRLNAWNNGILSDEGLKVISSNPSYNEAYQVLDEYLKFLKSYPEYGDMVPVVKAFAKTRSIPITQ